MEKFIYKIVTIWSLLIIAIIISFHTTEIFPWNFIGYIPWLGFLIWSILDSIRDLRRDV